MQDAPCEEWASGFLREKVGAGCLDVESVAGDSVGKLKARALSGIADGNRAFGESIWRDVGERFDSCRVTVNRTQFDATSRASDGHE